MESSNGELSGKLTEWTRNLTGMPPFTHELLQEHMITNTANKVNNGQPNNAHKHKKAGYQLFKDKMVTQVLVKANIMKGKEKFFLMKCVVHASMKKTEYSVYVHFYLDTGKIFHANCSCAAGKCGCCKHVAALLFQLLDFTQLELTEVPDDLTCTQLLQQQHVPPNEKLETALLFDQVKFTKATCKKEKVYHPDYNNPSPAFSENVTECDLKKLENGLKTADSCHYFQGLLKSNHHKPWEYNNYLEGLPSKKVFIDANLHASQLYNNNIRKSVLDKIAVPDLSEVCKHLPSQEYAPYVQNNLYSTKEQMADLECNTRGQSD